MVTESLVRPLGYQRVYLPLYKVADTQFHIQGGFTKERRNDGQSY